MMKKKILERYSRTPDNKLRIDIAAGKVADLYNDFDKHAPYRKKELDPDLVDYIVDSVSEIGREEFVIHFRFQEAADRELTKRVEKSVQNYFLYLKDLELRELAKMTSTSLLLFAIGVVILSLSVWTSQKIEGQGGVIAHVFAEGLNVAAWVSLWNAIATYLINWMPHRRQRKLYERVAGAAIHFS